MKDRVIQGMIAGIGGWLPQFIFTMTMFLSFHLTKLRFLDFAGILAFGHKPQGVLESFYSETIVIGQMVVFGMLFSLVVKIISGQGLHLKGGIFGWLCWFSIYVLADLYKTQGIHGMVDFPTAAINLTASVIWGVGMAWTFSFIERKQELKTARTSKEKTRE